MCVLRLWQGTQCGSIGAEDRFREHLGLFFVGGQICQKPGARPNAETAVREDLAPRNVSESKPLKNHQAVAYPIPQILNRPKL